MGKEVERGFEQEMVAHLAEFSPALFKAIGEEQMRKAVRAGIRKADGYGFDKRGSVRFCLEMMLLFGSQFDTDPQYPWAAELLLDREAAPDLERAGLLYKRTMHYRENVVGPDSKHMRDALKRIREWARQELPFSQDSFHAGIMQEIRLLYPEKAEYVGPEALDELLREAIEEARQRQLRTLRGVAAQFILMLMFGHGCAEDPLCPWIGGALRDPAITDPAAHVKRLETRALTWLDHVLAHFDQGIA